jgi:hypothetical protein
MFGMGRVYEVHPDIYNHKLSATLATSPDAPHYARGGGALQRK